MLSTVRTHGREWREGGDRGRDTQSERVKQGRVGEVGREGGREGGRGGEREVSTAQG